MTEARIGIFDIETRKMSDELEDGWDALRRGEGGISAVAVWDTKYNRMYLYDDHTIEECAAHLEEVDAVVGFNSIGFDIPVIEGVLGRRLRLKHSIDILPMIWNALRKRGERHFRGNTLDEVSRRTIGRGKTGKGASAPELAKNGQWAKLFSYCMNDTDLTRELFEYILARGGLNDMNGNHLALDIPAWLRPKDTTSNGELPATTS